MYDFSSEPEPAIELGRKDDGYVYTVYLQIGRCRFEYRTFTDKSAKIIHNETDLILRKLGLVEPSSEVTPMTAVTPKTEKKKKSTTKKKPAKKGTRKPARRKAKTATKK